MSDDPEKMMRVWKLGRNATEGVIAIVKVKRFAKFFRRAAKLNGKLSFFKNYTVCMDVSLFCSARPR